MAYAYLIAGIFFEVLSTITMKYSDGFSKPVMVVLTIVFQILCFAALAITLKTLPLGMVYAIWAGVGTAVMALLGPMIFNETLPLQKILATSLIVLGVVLLNAGEHARIKNKMIERASKAGPMPLSVELPKAQVSDHVALPKGQQVEFNSHRQSG